MNSEQHRRTGEFAASVVIPAHNEASVIGRLLGALGPKMESGELEVVVACNGCTDDTADVARRHGAIVVEVETASKVAALNAADEVATGFPRLYVDADVILTGETVDDLVRALSEPGLLCAAPPSNMNLAGRPWAIRAFFAVQRQVMLAREGYVGSGVYAVSKQGRKRFGRFPDVIADDLFVRNAYTRSERRIVVTRPTIVEAPRTLRALLRRRIRVLIGNQQVTTHPDFEWLPGNREVRVPLWRVLLVNPWLIPTSFVYVLINGIARVVASLRRQGETIDWASDQTTREPR